MEDSNEIINYFITPKTNPLLDEKNLPADEEQDI
jgi:hypothetical protein